MHLLAKAHVGETPYRLEPTLRSANKVIEFVLCICLSKYYESDVTPKDPQLHLFSYLNTL